MAAPPPVGWVRVSSQDPPLQVTARLADERPNVDTGFGGWDSVERPRRPPLTTFKAPPGRQLTLPILLDEWENGASIELQIDILARMGRPVASDGEPPQLKVSATGNAVPYQELTWVISEIAWGDALMNRGGNRVRQQVTLTLTEFIEDVYLQQKSAAVRRQTKAKAKKTKKGAATKRVNVKKNPKKQPVKGRAARVATTTFGDGEDLLSIAARELGDADRWLEIAQLNGLRDPRAMREGQVIRLP